MNVAQKITTGFVVQLYDNNGIPTSQEFVAGDEVDWEAIDGELIDYDKAMSLFNLPDGQKTEFYLPFEMKQPHEIHQNI